MNVPGALAEITAWAEPAAGGWRYLFSDSYRAQKHADWRHEHPGYVVLDLLGGIIGIGVSLAIAVFPVMAISGLLPN
jgi:hypothetical protein